MIRKVLILALCFSGNLGVYFEDDRFITNTGLYHRIDERQNPLYVSLEDRSYCGSGDTPPDNRHDTSERVANLILAMENANYDAYIIPSSDEHQNEYVADADKRREYISGFTGSAGTAVVLANGTRALWTDGRYFLQADEELDCMWLLMKDGEDGVPSIEEWIMDALSPGQNVAADARLIGADLWIEIEITLNEKSITVIVDSVVDGNDLLDTVWNNDGRPAAVYNTIFDHEIEFAGVSWQDKIDAVKDEMNSYGVQAFIVTALDEIAWLLNLRGSDIPYNPVFQSYVVVDIAARDPPAVTLYIKGFLSQNASSQLSETGSCDSQNPCVTLIDLNDIDTGILYLDSRTDIDKIMISGGYSYSLGASYYIYNLITASKRVLEPSPILFMKAKKNSVEQNNMRNAHIKDATALISFLGYIDDQISSGATNWTEVSAQDELAEYRYAEKDNMGLSFETISAFGANAAIIHYTATQETDTPIDDTNVYLLDSGGQYKDGTTDVTRTVHFGTPDATQIEAYTRVLMGVIDFADINIPKGTGKYYTDVLARRYLYDVGWDYRHGTSHGVGMFLYVHESSDDVYELGFCGSDEPGYYEDGSFGIRIENIVMVVETTTTHNFTAESYAFETLTLVPFEKKLIDTSMLTKYQCEWLNTFNAKVTSTIGPILQASGNDLAYNYMMDKTDILC